MFKCFIATLFYALLWAYPAAAQCTVTNMFTNGLTADATQVNQNFSDLASCAAPPLKPTR